MLSIIDLSIFYSSSPGTLTVISVNVNRIFLSVNLITVVLPKIIIIKLLFFLLF